MLDAADWLRANINPIKTPRLGSYGLKHMLERATDDYISNGEFIAAALIVGYPHRYRQPNVLFGMSARDVKRITKSRRWPVCADYRPARRAGTRPHQRDRCPLPMPGTQPRCPGPFSYSYSERTCSAG